LRGDLEARSTALAAAFFPGFFAATDQQITIRYRNSVFPPPWPLIWINILASREENMLATFVISSERKNVSSCSIRSQAEPRN
jgi:hypothetical protein